MVLLWDFGYMYVCVCRCVCVYMPPKIVSFTTCVTDMTSTIKMREIMTKGNRIYLNSSLLQYILYNKQQPGP